MLLSPIRSASLISLQCIEAVADPHSDGRPNRLICGKKRSNQAHFLCSPTIDDADRDPRSNAQLRSLLSFCLPRLLNSVL